MEESKGERVGGGKEVLLPSLPNPTLSPFFLAHFPLHFPNYLKACYRLTTCLPSFPTFYGIYSTWVSSTFGALLLISRNRFGSTNFSTAFRLWNCHFFLPCFLSFIFSLSVFISPQSHSLSPPPTPCSRQERTTICFAPDHSFDYSRLLNLHKKYGLFCGLKDFALIDVSVSWKLLLYYWTADDRLKDWKFLSTVFGKRTSSFPPKKSNNKNWETK